MVVWRTVLLSQARQVAQLAGMPEAEWPDPAVNVPIGYADIRGRGDLTAAADYLAHALPRFEAVAWAAHVLDGDSRHRDLGFRERLALDTVARWLEEPNDAHRRAAHDAAQAASARSPERCLGWAVFVAGGSIAPPGLPPIPPPPHAVGRYAAGAVKQAGYRSGDPAAFLAKALSVGEAVAERGASALTEIAA